MGEGWEGVAKSLQNRLEHAVRVAEHVIVPKAQDPKSLTLEPGAARGVRFHPVGVLSPIDLDDQAAAQANEIDDVAANGRLAAEPMSRDMLAAENGP